jgi:hypothetical protein
MKVNFGTALKSLTPNASWSLVEEDYENISWGDNSITKPSKEQIIAEMNRLQIIEDARVLSENTTKQSALAKLTALGLTQDEVKALVG